MNVFKKIGRGSWIVFKYYSCFYAITEYVIPVDVVVCSGESMVPIIQPYDVVLGEKSSVRRNDIRRNDIVISVDPFNPSSRICKRVAAVGGEEINFSLNDSSKTIKEIVRRGHVFLMGNPFADSYDSRYYGTVPSGLIKSRVFMRLWPINRFGLIKSNDDENDDDEDDDDDDFEDNDDDNDDDDDD